MCETEDRTCALEIHHAVATYGVLCGSEGFAVESSYHTI